MPANKDHRLFRTRAPHGRTGDGGRWGQEGNDDPDPREDNDSCPARHEHTAIGGNYCLRGAKHDGKHKDFQQHEW